jgi:type IV secretion system protein VirB10
MADPASSPINSASPISRPPMKLWKKAMIVMACLVILILLGIMGLVGTVTQQVNQEIRADQVGGSGRPFVPLPPEAQAPPPASTPQQSVQQATARPGSAPPPKGMMERILPGMPGSLPGQSTVKIRHFQAKGVRPSAPPGSPDQSAGGDNVASVGTGTGDALDNRLNAGADPDTVVATRLPDRNLFLTMGTGMPCISEQPINTDVPGPFRCKVKGNVMSTSGNVSLLDDGTWIFGRMTESLERGKRRAFGVVTRVETPDGCLIKLRAPVGDQLGTSGVDGEIDTHFFERFRGAALLALFDIASQTAAIAASNAIGGGNGISFNQLEMGARDLGEGTVGDDVNIPPTLKAAQSKRMLITVMSDIDMRKCYALRIKK